MKEKSASPNNEFAQDMTRIGLISDTHGLLRPETREWLADVDLILHAGDVGEGHVLEGLRQIAPVIAVRGNVDQGPWAENLALREVIQVEENFLYLFHKPEDLDLDPVGAGFQVIIMGHTHKPFMRQDQGVLYINPGSFGPRRFRLPIGLAYLDIEGPVITPSFRTLSP